MVDSEVQVNNKMCYVDSCNNKPAYKNGLCPKHHMQIKNHGKILKRTKYDKNEIITYGDYAEIILYDANNREVAKTIIDINDIDKVRNYKWYLSNGYVISRKKSIYLHRLLLNVCNDNDNVVDHKDRNTLNNSKSNLRICTQHNNSFNSGLKKNNTSGVSGVSWSKSRNKWLSKINIKEKQIYLGRFVNKDEAIKIRLQAELKYFGEFAPQRHLFQQYEIKEGIV